jgi:hypothetical protein
MSQLKGLWGFQALEERRRIMPNWSFNSGVIASQLMPANFGVGLLLNGRLEVNP